MDTASQVFVTEMSDSQDQSQSAERPDADVRLNKVFACSRIQIDVEVSSTRRLIEVIAKLFANGSQHEMHKDTVFRSLLERERLGSTCVGNGVMIPHSRLHSLPAPIGAIVRMTTPLEVDADDDTPVSLACGLLVPAECSDLHIRILARLAEGFVERDLHQRLMGALDERELYDQLVQFDNETPRR